jgi:SAM-dependent methyltransferase
MNVPFAAYGAYYDLLYHDKDYESEARYVEDVIARVGGTVGPLLELGCGTGRHARLLADRGFQVTGVEMSEQMLAQARHREMRMPNASGGGFSAHLGDVRSFRTAQRFATVISLFHVVSYLTSTDDLYRFLETASHHLRDGGHLIFDAWYGPAVLSQQPAVRVKRLENEQIRVVRIAEPVMDVRTSVVRVNYTIVVTDKTTSDVTELSESHPMRYYFESELSTAAVANDLEILFAEEWLTRRPPSSDTWGVVFVLTKRGTIGRASAGGPG